MQSEAHAKYHRIMNSKASTTESKVNMQKYIERDRANASVNTIFQFMLHFIYMHAFGIPIVNNKVISLFATLSQFLLFSDDAYGLAVDCCCYHYCCCCCGCYCYCISIVNTMLFLILFLVVSVSRRFSLFPRVYVCARPCESRFYVPV